MRFNYKVVPLQSRHPAYPNSDSHWMPILGVKLSKPRGKPTPRFEVLVDSGADDCLFRGEIGQAIGLDVTKGIKGTMTGIAAGSPIEVYYHQVSLWVGVDIISITAGFCPTLSVAGLLGRRGFFEHFMVTFDPCATPPGFELQRVGRS